jgi:tetratricopeptide (TPR) repeat protein
VPGERRSLQDLIRGRQQSGFVGRQRQVVQYRENLELPIEDERRRFLFNIHGDAGVGKTYLTKQLRQIANDCRALTAYVDDTVDDVMSAMTAIAADFKRGGISLDEFEKRAARYRARRQELESDPNAPVGVTAFLTKAAVTIGMQAARDIPFAGSLLAPVDVKAVADQADRARAYLARKISDHADLRLLLSPEDELTPVFVAGLNHVAAGRQIALFFDTYERTTLFLDRWLRNLYAGLYGDLPITLVTTISGQNPLNPNLWGEYLPVITDVSLEPFSEAEARQFLGSKNVRDEHTVQVILTLSGRLPMWLATLADARPDDPADIGDPAGDAVERFLKWEDDPNRRTAAVTAALPRTLNQDVLATIIPSDDAGDLFRWLCGLPFVSRQGSSWRYHQVVRSAMLRLKRAQSPNEWRTYHVALAQANAQWAADAAGGTDKTWVNSDWIDYTCEETYHSLCADPSNTLPRALGFAVKAAEHSTARARQWAGLLTETGRDSANAEIQHWGELLQNGIRDEDLSQYLSYLINDAHLDDVILVIALEERGANHRTNGRYEEALADFDRAIELDPEDDWAIISRGQTHRTMGRYAEALADFDRAIELEPESGWAIISRGETYEAMGRYAEALADFDRAIELEPESGWAIANRGETYEAMGRYAEALADFDRAIELDPEDDWAIINRGQTYQAMGRYAEALADFDLTTGLDPEDGLAANLREQAYQAMGRHVEELAGLDRAIEADPSDARAIYRRSQIHLMMARYDEGLTDLRHAIELDANIATDLAYSLISVAADYLRSSRPEMAAALFEAVISVMPNDARAHNHYAFCLLPFDRAAALVELDTANTLGFKDLANLADRVLALHLLGRNEESIALATSEEARKTPSTDGLMWIVQEDHTLLLSSWVDIRQYLRSLLVHIDREHN